MDLKELATGVEPGRHWYYRSKRLPLISFARAACGRDAQPVNVIDIGAGSGFFSESLLAVSDITINDLIRVDTAYTAESSEPDLRLKGRLIQRRHPPARIENSLILLMDVLEHIERDEEFLRSIATKCAGRNSFFITVPAFQSLWSQHDVFLQHFRRYRLNEIESVAVRAGLEIRSAYYFFGAILPAVWTARKLKPMGEGGSDMRKTGALPNLLLECLCRGEFPLRKANRLGGLTCVVEAATPS